jgi:hypothetical protein
MASKARRMAGTQSFTVVTSTGGSKTATFTNSFPAGIYTIESLAGDADLEIYLGAEDGTNVGHVTGGSKAITASAPFKYVTTANANSSDAIIFSLYPTLTNATTLATKTDAFWAPPTITDITPSGLANINSTTTITGTNFASNVDVKFRKSDDATLVNAKTIVRGSATSIIAGRPDSFAPGDAPYDVVVTNPSTTLSAISLNAITSGAVPVWVTSTTLNPATLTQAFSQTIQATDADGSSTITYAIVSGAFQAGLSFNTSTGAITGTPTGSAGNTTIVISATDSGGNAVNRTFTQVIADSNLIVEYLVVAGGGGGGANSYGGGGGAGGYRTSASYSLPLNTLVTVEVGAGGSGATGPTGGVYGTGRGFNGVQSRFGTIIATGGGGGGGQSPAGVGATGGSGGGGAGLPTSSIAGGSGNQGGYSPVEGYAGGAGGAGSPQAGGGGGSSGVGSTSGAGGAGTSNSITGSSLTYAAGGNGIGDISTSGGASDGSVNTGNGGGGWLGGADVGDGGSGIVVVRYISGTQKAQGGTITTSGGYYIHKFTSSGNFYTGMGTISATPVAKATGGTITTDGTNWIHTFTGSGTFTPTQSLTANYLVVAGGGGGGRAGGGGAGGLRSTVTATGGGGSLETALSLSSGTGYTVTIGGGGTGSDADGTTGTAGVNSVFSTITSIGGSGGNGGGANNPVTATGGSGGGGSFGNPAGSLVGGAPTQYQGFAGGAGLNGGGGGGGGGAGAAGSNAVLNGNPEGGTGGIGLAIAISGTSTYYAGGGGGAAHNAYNGGPGGNGGGGQGETTPASGSKNSTFGTPNTGGGGGGSHASGGNNGGSGIVIIRYPI